MDDYPKQLQNNSGIQYNSYKILETESFLRQLMKHISRGSKEKYKRNKGNKLKCMLNKNGRMSDFEVGHADYRFTSIVTIEVNR